MFVIERGAEGNCPPNTISIDSEMIKEVEERLSKARLSTPTNDFGNYKVNDDEKYFRM